MWLFGGGYVKCQHKNVELRHELAMGYVFFLRATGAVWLDCEQLRREEQDFRTEFFKLQESADGVTISGVFPLDEGPHKSV